MTVTPTIPSQDLCQMIEEILNHNKASNIVTLDISKKTNIADYMIIASGSSQRQISTFANHIEEKLKLLHHSINIEGLSQADWVLVDAGDVIVHLFRPEIRAFYNLENMWGEDFAEHLASA